MLQAFCCKGRSMRRSILCFVIPDRSSSSPKNSSVETFNFNAEAQRGRRKKQPFFSALPSYLCASALNIIYLTMIIGLTGKNAAGKGAVATFLRDRSFYYYSLSDVIREELERRKIPITRDSLIATGNE